MSAARSVSVGVVVPLHDKRAWVRRAVESVLNQTRRDLELVVVDDGSTDGGAELLRDIDDPRLRVMRTARRGPGAARNTGARLLATPWLAFLDADDEWDTSFLARALDAVAAAPATVAVYCDVQARGAPAPRRRISSGPVRDYFGTRLREGAALSSSSNLVSAAAFVAIGGFPEGVSHGEDIETWLRLACRGPFYFIAEPLCVIEVGAGTLTASATPRERAAGLARLIACARTLERDGAIPSDLLPAVRTFMNHQQARQALHLAGAGERSAALRLLARTRLDARTWKDFARTLLRVAGPRA